MKPTLFLVRALTRAAAALALLFAPASGLRADATNQIAQRRFSTPEEAAQALAAAAKSGDRAALDALFGPEVKGLLSGDARQDDIEFAAFAKAIGQFSHMVRKDGAWLFDTLAGKEEILNRRIGEGEATAIGVCRAYVLAQREYASEDRDGSGVLKFAQRLKSTPGKKDGLCWPAGPGEVQSPLGPLVAEARAESDLNQDQ